MEAKQTPETLAASGAREDDLAGQRVDREFNPIAYMSQEVPETALSAALRAALARKAAI